MFFVTESFEDDFWKMPILMSIWSENMYVNKEDMNFEFHIDALFRSKHVSFVLLTILDYVRTTLRVLSSNIYIGWLDSLMTYMLILLFNLPSLVSILQNIYTYHEANTYRTWKNNI